MGCGLINEDGVFEICDQNSHQFNTMQPIHVTKNMALQAHYNATVTYSKVILRETTNVLLLTTSPFKVGFCSEYPNTATIPLIDQGTTIPTRRSISVANTNPDKNHILIGQIPIQLNPEIVVGPNISGNLFHITSNTFEVIIEINTYSMIYITIKDNATYKETTHSLHTILRAPFNEYT